MLLIAALIDIKKESEVKKPSNAIIVKGKDSILNGITQMMDYKIIVDKNSYNIQTELNNYRWHDKIQKPVDDYNHTIDAIRYAFDELNAAPMFFG